MQKYFIIAVTFCSFFFINQLNAQSPRLTQRWDEAIESLRQSEFTIEFRKMKMRIEQDIAIFKVAAAEEQTAAADIEDIRKSYTLTAEKFDAVLEALKQGFTNPIARKTIAGNPAAQTESLRADLEAANQFYMNECFKPITELVPEYFKDRSFGLTEIGLLISLTKEVIELIGKEKQRINKLSGDYFEQHFISPLRLKAWEEY